MSKIHNCETCGQKVVVGGEGTTHFYIGKESELAQQAMLDDVIDYVDNNIETNWDMGIDYVDSDELVKYLKKKYGSEDEDE